MSEPETDRLAAAVVRKRECLLRLREAGLVQRDLILRGELSELLRLLATKQRLLDQLQLVERELEPFRGQDPQQRQWRSESERSSCAAALGDCQSLLAQIVEQERSSEETLRSRRDEAALRLEEASHAGQSRAAYTATAHSRSESLGQLDLRTGD